MHFHTTSLEFDKILTMVASYAHTLQGKELVAAITPTNDPLLIGRLLNETNQALDIINRYQEMPFGGIRDVSDILYRAKIHSILRPTHFLDVIGLIEATTNAVRFFKQVTEHEIDCDYLAPYYDELAPTPRLKQQIEQVITIDGYIHDNASSALLKIRNKIQRNEQKINERLQHILHSQKNKLAEALITIRNNRYVVPVKLSEKNNFDGSVVDYSKSGETAYIEPKVVAEINNEINLLKLEEEREVERILHELTLLVGDQYGPLSNNFFLLTTFDVIFAKAKFALAYDCSMPDITEDTIDLRHARHPLINQDDVVANTITYQPDERIIIITGPNTGGKTVTLKTMGLLSLMNQSGLLIPVEHGSKTIIFENIFADIGDEQSIEQSLSTFSSHMTRIIDIINNLSVGSLILLDELGSGTDPKEGASLAISLLDYIRIRGVYVIATTHYPELKAYAYDKEEIINASVEFDVESLQPTYRLLLGTPGKSNALLISERLGLHEKIIEAAKANVLTSQSEVSDLINKLEHKGAQLDKRITEYEALIAENKKLVKHNEQLQIDLMKEKQKYNRKISVEQSQILQDTKEHALNLIKEIEALKEKANIKDHEIAELKYKTKQLNLDQELESSTKEHTYQPGDIVNVLKFNRTGELIKKQNNNQWIVKMGVLSSTFDEDDIEFIERKVIEEPQSKIIKSVKKRVSPELDLRGMRYEEAKHALDQYIDDCLVSNMPFATIIHGYGTLTLRKLVKKYLDSSKHIKSHRDGEGNEGGNGVTIVNFK
ncbi:endonuclease MutS2 [Candidatus Xianfuyuplasma coldseepsis]|uniref:Endonuclease MutS2 n=1 Tax=Candidatus Xianfuyuplasma coldseepsis TaxID=2782163 RepID=A0A7L7KT36_9MOLU|nr:endonuclease MutS2 [Xianfuyuplasma coldseepsis]QMS85867.1 endonuclease MutS2 [Xianfuyuplasma coldseepsis]